MFLSFLTTATTPKCVYNNFEARKLFECPPFDGSKPFVPSFKHTKELYNLERAKPVNMTYELNH